jgi:hypothetical protein
MALILPVFLFIVLGTLELGFAFDHNLTLAYSSREGARVGAALVNGGGQLGCSAGQSPKAATVDPTIIAAVQRVLKSSGSPVLGHLNDVNEIRIYQATTSGSEAGPVNRWTYAPAGGPVVDGAPLDFAPSTPQSWPACSRTNGSTPDSIGVSVSYTYRLQTPLSALLGVLTFGMNDRTVMAANPTPQ